MGSWNTINLVHNFPLIVIDDLFILLAMTNNLVHSSMYYVHKIPQIPVDK